MGVGSRGYAVAILGVASVGLLVLFRHFPDIARTKDPECAGVHYLIYTINVVVNCWKPFPKGLTQPGVRRSSAVWCYIPCWNG